MVHTRAHTLSQPVARHGNEAASERLPCSSAVVGDGQLDARPGYAMMMTLMALLLQVCANEKRETACFARDETRPKTRRQHTSESVSPGSTERRCCRFDERPLTPT